MEVSKKRVQTKVASKTSSPRKLLCFICQKEVDREMFIVVNYTYDEMICICRKHFELYLARPQKRFACSENE